MPWKAVKWPSIRAALLMCSAAIVVSQAHAVQDPKRSANDRYAIVVGNGDYDTAGKLQNAVSDARVVADMLRRHGFAVDERYDLDKAGFEDLMRSMLYQTSPDSEFVFYYAGHGIQIGRENYILPIDADLSSPYDTPFETLTLNSILNVIGNRSRQKVVILDSCRNNPFSDAQMMTQLDRSLYEAKSGFQPMTAPLNSLLSFSTSPGAVALDGDGVNSPFTSALVDVARENPESRLRDILDNVRARVHQETNGEQVPWESSTLIAPFYLQKDDDDIQLAAVDEQPVTLNPFTIVDANASRNSASSGPVVIETKVDREIALGRLLDKALSVDPETMYGITGQIGHGRLRLKRAGRMADYDGSPVSGGELRSLVYMLEPATRSGTAPAESLILSETVRVTPAEGAQGAAGTFELRMVPQECDREAGNYLDPEGVGLARFANQIDPETAIPACEAAAAEFPTVGRYHYQLGRAYLANREYEKAKEAYVRAKDLGHTRAWTGLGTLIDTMQSIESGVNRDRRAPDESLELHAKGVELGDPYAYYALGREFLLWGTTEAARQEGFALMEQSISFGHTFAMNELGYFFLNSESEYYEPDRGLRYLQESAKREDVYGYHNLGLVFERGLGGKEPDPELAFEWYKKASDGMHPLAPVNIGRMIYQGRLSGGSDPVAAIEWYDLGLSRGGAWGGANAAWIIANKRPKGFEPMDAAVRAAKSAVLSDEEAAKESMSILRSLKKSDINKATQKILSEFVDDVAIDGIVGPATQGAIAKLTAEVGIETVPEDPVERLTAIARVFWSKNGIRIDLL